MQTSNSISRQRTGSAPVGQFETPPDPSTTSNSLSPGGEKTVEVAVRNQKYTEDQVRSEQSSGTLLILDTAGELIDFLYGKCNRQINHAIAKQ